MRSLLVHGPALLMLLSSIPDDRDFCVNFPDDMLPLLRQATLHDSKSKLFYPETVKEESVVGSELCCWVRHVVALIFAAKKGELVEDKTKVLYSYFGVFKIEC